MAGAKSPGALLAKIRWATTGTTEAHSDAARANGIKGGRPKVQDRCPCGAMTKDRAAKRNHVCEAKKDSK
jgi:hypothetical protein